MDDRSFFPFAAALVLAVAGLVACAAQGPRYDEVSSGAEPLAADHVRVVFLRPRDRDDGANGGRAVVHIDGDRAGAIAYGGFFYVDTVPGTPVVSVSGRYRMLGACDLQLHTTGGETVFIDVGPRVAHMIVSTVGSIVGGLLGGAAVPQAAGSVEEALVGGTAAVAAGAAAGEAVAGAAANEGTPCGGPYRIAPLDADEALARLDGLAWSR